MAEQTKKSFFETRLMRSKIKSQTVSLFPEAGLGYLLGPILALMGNGVINMWLMQYWDKVLGLGAWAPIFEAVFPIGSAIIIIIGNLLVGRLMERKPSLAGKARPLILISMPFILVAMLILFLIPFPEAAQEATLLADIEAGRVVIENGAIKGTPTITGGLLASIFIFIGYNLYYAVAWPIYYTSHSALVNLSTRDSGKRGLLGTAIMAAQLAAAGVSGMAGGVLVDLLGLLPKYTYAETITNKEGVAETVKTTTNDFVEALTKGNYTIDITRAQANQKWTILMIVMVVALIVGCLLEYFFTRERITEDNIESAKAAAEKGEENKDVKKVTMAQQIKICMKDKAWWLLMIFWFLYQFGGMMKNNAMPWYSQVMTGGNAVSSVINTVGAVPTALGMAIVWPLAVKFTKAKTISLGGVVAALAASLSFVALGFIGNVGAITGISVASFCIKALGTAPAMYISIALMANILDHQEAVHGVRTDGFTMAVYGSIMVAMSGICNGIIAGFNAMFPTVEARRIVHTILAFGVEGACYLAIAIMFLFMNVEKFTNVDNKAIIADQKAEVLAADGKWIEPEERAKQEEAENARLIEEARVAELQAKCEKKKLNFEEENAKFLAQKAEADKKAEEKKAAAEQKKQAKLAAMTAEQKAIMEKKAEEKKAKQAEADKKALEELNMIRKQAGRPAVEF